MLGSGKEKRRNMSEMLEKILSNENIGRAYKRVYGSMKAKLQSIDEHLRTQIRVIIWKQWKVSSKREWGLLKLGVPDWIAYKVANWGDHYQFVATKSVLARAISKEKLTKRGLVSLSDYYPKVAHV